MRKSIMLIIIVLVLSAYVYTFVLCSWGKPLYGTTGNFGYLIAFHVLAMINYFILNSTGKYFGFNSLKNKSELFFFLHGSLLSVFPYNGYLLAGTVLMGAALIAAGVKAKLYP